MTRLPAPGERFIILCGRSIEPWVYHDEIFKLTRSEVVRMIVSGEPANPEESIVLIIGFDLDAGKCRDATQDIMNEARNEIPSIFPSPVDRMEWARDPKRDERKNWSA